MAKLKRAYIPMRERYAAALACLLPQALRDLYRDKQVPADLIISQFEVDHIVLHCFGGSDEWHNLDLVLKPEHRVKSAKDTSIVAKVRRLEDKWRDFTQAMANGKKPSKRRGWGKRPFPKRRRA